MRRVFRTDFLAGLWAVAAGLAALAGPAANAGELAAIYDAYWAGVPAGEIRLSLNDDASPYHDRIDIRSLGLARLVTRFRGTATTDGELVAGRLPLPTRHEATYDLRKRRDRRLSMIFARQGGGTLAERGAEDTSRKPPLAAKFRTDVLDPLSAVTAIRDALRQGRRGAFVIPVYDGARRFDVKVAVHPARGRDAPLELTLTLAPIAGFKGETSEDGDPDTVPRPVALTMSNDSRLMPLSMSVSLYYLPLVVQLSRWCGSASACAW
jgi:hypothetical protein